MDTMARVMELAEERDLSLFQLAQLCDVSYNTLKTAGNRNTQLTVDTIERICIGLRMPMSRFFAEAERSGRK